MQWYENFSKIAAKTAGRSITFNIACLLILAWVVTGPMFNFSDTWQLVINTSTTIVTFLMGFLIQHTQNKETEALQLKLNELLRATKGAHKTLIDLEESTEHRLASLKRKYKKLSKAAQKNLSATAGELEDLNA